MKFPEFNKVVNPNDEKCYIVKTQQGMSSNKSFMETKPIAENDATSKIYWIIQEGFYVIEIEEKRIIDLIIKKSENVIIIKDDNINKYQIIMRGEFNKTTQNNILACGPSCNTYAYSKTQTTILLPFKCNNNIDPYIKNISIIYGNYNEMLEEPSWLIPIKKRGSTTKDGIEIPIIALETKLRLSNQLRLLKEFSSFDREDILNIMNNNLCDSPITTDELNAILYSGSKEVTNDFFDGNNFLHNVLGNYIIEKCHIKMDEDTNDLYFFDEKKRIYVNNDEYIKSYITKLCPQLKDFQKDETIKYIKAVLYGDTVRFNSNPYTIVFKNGMLDISTMEFKQVTSNDLETIQINCNYNPYAKSKTADEFFHTATSGNKETETLLYEAIGYAMLKTSELATTFLMVGEGRNGKSTYMDLIHNVLNEKNTTSISLKDLKSNFRPSLMMGKLASLAADISSQELEDTDVFKNIASGDRIVVERKYKDAAEVRLFSTLFFACNKMPHTPDTSNGFYRRFTIIPFNADLSKVSKVDGMTFKRNLLTQESLDYVAYKAVKAIERVMNTTLNFTEPKEVIEMKDKYKAMNSSVYEWYAFVIHKDNNTLNSYGLEQSYATFSNWATQNGRKSMSKSTFENKIKYEIGYKFINN